jgi:hypothetical protein
MENDKSDKGNQFGKTFDFQSVNQSKGSKGELEYKNMPSMFNSDPKIDKDDISMIKMDADLNETKLSVGDKIDPKEEEEEEEEEENDDWTNITRKDLFLKNEIFNIIVESKKEGDDLINSLGKLNPVLDLTSEKGSKFRCNYLQFNCSEEIDVNGYVYKKEGVKYILINPTDILRLRKITNSINIICDEISLLYVKESGDKIYIIEESTKQDIKWDSVSAVEYVANDFKDEEDVANEVKFKKPRIQFSYEEKKTFETEIKDEKKKNHTTLNVVKNLINVLKMDKGGEVKNLLDEFKSKSFYNIEEETVDPDSEFNKNKKEEKSKSKVVHDSTKKDVKEKKKKVKKRGQKKYEKVPFISSSKKEIDSVTKDLFSSLGDGFE